MVAGATRRLAKVPKFASLRDFLLAKKWYTRALFMPCTYLEGPERDDLQQRLWRHNVTDAIKISPVFLPSRSPLSRHISSTLADVRSGLARRWSG